MRTKLLPGCFLLGIFSNAYAQSKNREQQLDIMIGASLPTGEFSSTDLSDPGAGFAKAGAMLRVSYSRFLNQNLAFTAAMFGQQNALNTKALENSLAQQSFNTGVVVGPGSPGPLEIPSEKYSNWQVEKKNWISAGLLVGATGEFAIGKKRDFLLTARGVIGAVYAKTPKLTATAISDTAHAYVTQSSSTGIGMGYSPAGGAKYWMKGNLFINLQLEYFGTNKLRFDDVKSTVSTTHFSNGTPVSASAGSFTSDQTQQISSFNICFGIGFKL